MPSLVVRKLADVPAPVHTAKAVREQQLLYESFLTEATGNVGEITLEAGDGLRSIKVKLRRAATRTGSELDIWDRDGKVYFQAKTPTTKRGRPRKAT